MQSWIDDLTPRCGPLAGAARQYLAHHGLDAAPPRGVEALRHLLASLRELEDAGEEGERNFVEAAGGFLALVLADRVADAHHVELDGDHGLRLGRFGFFDPFAGIACALDADDLAQALIATVAGAEAEAEDRSGEARVVGELSRQLASEAPELEVVQRFRMRVFLGGGPQDIEVDIAPLVEATRGETDATVSRAVGKVVSSLCGRAPTPERFEEVRERILPRLVGEAFLRRLSEGGAAERLCLSPLSGEVSLGFILDHGNRARFLRRAEVEAWGLDADTLMLAALSNLAARSARARVMRVEELGGSFVVASTRDGLDAARMLLPGLHGLLSAELGDDIVVALPHRDVLVACDAGDARSVEALRRRAADESARAPHPISADIYRLLPGGGIAPA